MRLTSHFFLSSTFFTLCAGLCVAQSPAPDPAGPETRHAGIIEQDQPDTHEDQATTRSVSQIRIVRLSQVRGQVQIDRGTGQKFEAAFTNLPIITGEQLRTQEGVAEVEFEDNSSMRLVMDSQLEFPELGRTVAGVTTTTVSLLRGSLYVSLAGGKTPSQFRVRVGRETLVVTPSSHLRVDVNQSTAKVTVFQGLVTAGSDSGSLAVGKHKAVTFDLSAATAPVFAKLDEPSPFDAWDKSSVNYHKTLAVASTYANSPYSYGVNDLAYYGAFSNVGGCGTMWRPYLATASFDPYASGIWTWYPTSGYSWVSPYPWGWTPFHSGSWSYCASGGGWGWQPHGGWNGLQNVPATTQQLRLKLPGTTPIHTPLPPVKGQPTMIGINLNRLQPSKPSAAGDSFVFQGGSAGLGVPRGVFNNLGKMSQHATQRGFATTSISDTQASRGLMPTSAAAMNAAGNAQGTAFNRGPGGSAGANRNTSIGNARSNAMSARGGATNGAVSSTMNRSAAGSRSMSSPTPSAPSGGAPAGGGAHH